MRHDVRSAACISICGAYIGNLKHIYTCGHQGPLAALQVPPCACFTHLKIDNVTLTFMHNAVFECSLEFILHICRPFVYTNSRMQEPQKLHKLTTEHSICDSINILLGCCAVTSCALVC